MSCSHDFLTFGHVPVSSFLSPSPNLLSFHCMSLSSGFHFSLESNTRIPFRGPFIFKDCNGQALTISIYLVSSLRLAHTSLSSSFIEELSFKSSGVNCFPTGPLAHLGCSPQYCGAQLHFLLQLYIHFPVIPNITSIWQRFVLLIEHCLLSSETVL